VKLSCRLKCRFIRENYAISDQFVGPTFESKSMQRGIGTAPGQDVPQQTH